MDHNQSDYESDKDESNQSGDIIINENIQNYESDLSNQSDQVLDKKELLNFGYKKLQVLLNHYET
ncbi:6110_t:CDS:2, partial [Racocetra fulgida]